MEKSTVEVLREEIHALKEKEDNFTSIVEELPDFFQLLCDMLDEDVLEDDDKLLIDAALAYLVIPNDLMPEDAYGSLGYMDDLFICTSVVRKLNGFYKDALKKLWEEEDFEKTLDNAYSTSKRFVEERDLAEKILDYVGIKGKV